MDARLVASWCRVAVAAAVTTAAANASPPSDVRRNWFDDPYFQVTNEVHGCPEPQGPFATEDEALQASHHRSERGTRCYLEGRCRYANSFGYDREIAQQIQSTLRSHAPHPSSLWILVQGRRAWVYGCVPRGYRRGTLETLLRKVPDVELAIEQLRVGPKGAVPYVERHADPH